MKTNRITRPLSSFPLPASLAFFFTFSVAPTWASPITGDTVTGSLTVQGDSLTIDDGTDPFEIRLGTNMIDLWRENPGDWVWSYGAGPIDVMALDASNRLNLYDLGLNSVDPAIVLSPGNPDLGITPYIMIGGSEVLTASSATNAGFIHSSNIGSQISNHLSSNYSLSLTGGVADHPFSTAMSGGFASGEFSVAIGGNPYDSDGSLYPENSYSTSKAYADYSVALSSGSTYGQYSTAMSHGLAYGEYSTAMSYSNAYSQYSTAMSFSTAYGDASTAMSFSVAKGTVSTAMSYGYAVGDYSTAMSGGDTHGFSSTAMSTGVANGMYSLASGIGVQASSYSEVAIGTYNAITTGDIFSGNTSSWHPNDPILQVGNGYPDTYEQFTGIDINGDGVLGRVLERRSNALTVYKSGTVEIGYDETDGSSPLKVNSDGSVILTKPQGDISMGNYQ